MLTLKLLQDFTGIETFLECLKWLKRDKYDHMPVLKCVRTKKPKVIFGKEVAPMKFDDDELTIVMVELKAAAMDEVYAQLPTRQDIEKIEQSIDSLLPNHRREEVLEILSKIITK